LLYDLLNKDKITWYWNSNQLGAEIGKLFTDVTDCKLTADNRILVTSSGDGGALVLHRDTFKFDFVASLKNAHSIELLPDGKIVAAASVGPDCLALYDSKPGRDLSVPINKIDFSHAHGLYWDTERKVLWAGGGSNITAYTYDGENLKEKKSYKDIIKEIHDITLLDENNLLVTGDETVIKFDLNTGHFKEHPIFGGQGNIKSSSVNSEGYFLYTQASEKCWWVDSFHVIDPDGNNLTYRLPEGIYWYKARWFYGS